MSKIFTKPFEISREIVYNYLIANKKAVPKQNGCMELVKRLELSTC